MRAIAEKYMAYNWFEIIENAWMRPLVPARRARASPELLLCSVCVRRVARTHTAWVTKEADAAVDSPLARLRNLDS